MRINPWCSHPEHSGTVDIGTHSLWASIRGPIRSSSDPLLIFITGAGGATAGYIKLQQALGTHIRALFYDRAGYDKSTLPPLDTLPDGKIYASSTARDLGLLLQKTGLEPPYIVVAHSYGGIIARTFLEQCTSENKKDAIAGMILVDTATELMLQLFPRVPPKELEVVGRNVDFLAITNFKEESGMSDEEFTYAIEAQKRCVEALQLEDTHGSARQLALHHQLDQHTLGMTALSVLKFNIVRDCQIVYDEGVKNGDGSEDEREKVRSFIDTLDMFHYQMARAQCDLSENAEFTAYDYLGHDAPLRNPVIIVKEVKKFLKYWNEV